MKAATLIFPHQLFRDHPSLKKEVPAIIVEEELFFNQYVFHKKKLMLHRASMKSYEAYLKMRGFATIYVEASAAHASAGKLIHWLAEQGCSEVAYSDLCDDWLAQRLARACNELKILSVVSESPGFVTPTAVANKYFDKKTGYFMATFYTAQRKRMEILVDMQGEPVGGKWSYDADNRLKYPAKSIPPVVKPVPGSEVVAEAQAYVQKHYPENYGTIDDFIYPVNFEQADLWLEDFLENRFEKFGAFEDAMVAKESFLHHSVLSPLLNTGLLTPGEVVKKALEFASTHQVPLNSLEGFVRQVIGWREFVRIVYEREGAKQRTTNYWGFTRKIPPSFWNATTGIIPVDNVVRKVLETGYSHHIERLMVMGNFMLLCEFDPDEVYVWFMEMYVDAYDWVMVPNVYGMTQFADGGLMTTKPYISGSNYLLKMSDFKKGEWSVIWDALFWRFMHVHRDFFLKNPRLGMLLKTFDKMTPERRNQIMDMSETFLASLDKQNLDKNETNKKGRSARQNL